MKKASRKPAVEGEGSYTGTRAYNEGLAKSIQSGRTGELAEKARKALEGPEGESLRKAEQIGKSGRPKHARKG